MKKLLILFVFAILSVSAFAQAPDNWRMPTATLNLTGNNIATVSSALVVDNIFGCCSTCTYPVMSGQTIVLTFTRTSGSTDPTITVNSQSVNFSGGSGTVTVNLGSPSYNTGVCPVTGSSASLTIKATASSSASYSISLFSIAASSCYYDTSTSSATVTTLNVTP